MPLLEVLVEQLEHPVERRQRRAQLVRGGGDERAARLLLLLKLLLHQRERAREVADLVAGAIDRHLDGGPSCASRSAAWRSRRSRRTIRRRRAGSPRSRVSASATSAATRNAVRTAETAVLTSSIGLRTTSTHRCVEP